MISDFTKRNAGSINKMLVNEYRMAALAVIAERRQVSGVNDKSKEKEESELSEWPRSGRQAAAVNEKNAKQIDAHRTADRKLPLQNSIKAFR